MHRTARAILTSTSQCRRQNLPNFSRSFPRSFSTKTEELQLEGERLIYSKLQERFNPSRLQVQDVSGGCGTFYAITIASKDFANIPTVQQHRLVNRTIKEEIEGIHGLQLKTIPDTEANEKVEKASI